MPVLALVPFPGQQLYGNLDDNLRTAQSRRYRMTHWRDCDVYCLVTTLLLCGSNKIPVSVKGDSRAVHDDVFRPLTSGVPRR
ncbi:hypothetical protein SAMN05414139_10797 [Burkholderia sp. D7]|jgi:hypothetical protein|nr:hypothetical protein SAMN05414139_10797 [Burkholderia sp. D7]